MTYVIETYDVWYSLLFQYVYIQTEIQIQYLPIMSALNKKYCSPAIKINDSRLYIYTCT